MTDTTAHGIMVEAWGASTNDDMTVTDDHHGNTILAIGDRRLALGVTEDRDGAFWTWTEWDGDEVVSQGGCPIADAETPLAVAMAFAGVAP